MILEIMFEIHYVTERKVAGYLLEKGDQLEHCSIRSFALPALPIPPLILACLSKKLGYPGWKDSKEAFLQEKEYIAPVQNNMFHDAIMTTAKDCAICISCSGETPTLLKTVKYLKKTMFL